MSDPDWLNVELVLHFFLSRVPTYLPKPGSTQSITLHITLRANITLPNDIWFFICFTVTGDYYTGEFSVIVGSGHIL